jgi:hypothetical protein
LTVSINNVIDGLLSSCRQMLKTVTVKLQEAVLPEASVAVQVTVVIPTGNADPDAGTQAVVTPGQLSVAVGAAKLIVCVVATGQDNAVVAVMLVGQVIDGG